MAVLLSIDTATKDLVQVVAWGATAIGVVGAAFKYLAESKANRAQRQSELRWKQADAGKKLNDEMLTDPEARAARQILDYDGRAFSVDAKTTHTVSHDDVRRVLDPGATVASAKDIYIRDCFDSLFYYMATFQHYIDRGLVLSEDVAFPLEYYVSLLAKFNPQVTGYLQRYGLSRAAAFLVNYSAWRKAEPKESTTLMGPPHPGSIPVGST